MMKIGRPSMNRHGVSFPRCAAWILLLVAFAGSAAAQPDAPAAPTGLYGVAGDEWVKLDWQPAPGAGGTGVLDYAVEYKQAAVAEWPASPRSVRVDAVAVIMYTFENGTTYTFRVKARYPTGLGPPSNEIELTPEKKADEEVELPGPPTRLVALASDAAVSLSWSAPELDGGAAVESYEVAYRLQADSVWTTGGPKVEVTGTTAAITELRNGSAYAFRVRAENAVGKGPWSEEATATPVSSIDPPGPPTGLTADADYEAVSLTWSAPSDDGGAPVTSYQVRHSVQGSGALSDWVEAPGGGNASRFTVADLSQGTAYTFHLRAMNEAGSGAASSIAATTLLDLSPSFGDVSVGPQVYTEHRKIPTLALPAAIGGDGELSYSLTPEPPPGVSFDAVTRELAGAPSEAQPAVRYIYSVVDSDATDPDAASISFTIEVIAAPSEGERDFLQQTLAELAGNTLSSAQETLSDRFDAAPGGGGSSAHSGLPGAAARGAQAAPFVSTGVERSGAVGTRAGLRASSGSSSGVVHPERPSSFALELNGAGGARMGAGPRWTVWGGGDRRHFDADVDGGSLNGSLQSGWFGVDARTAGGTLAGVAISRGSGKIDQGFESAGRLESDLTTTYFYMQRGTDEAKVRFFVGAGGGDLEHQPVDRDLERADLEMTLGSFGGNWQLMRRGRLTISATADAGMVNASTEEGPRSVGIAGLKATVWRVRGGFEAAHDGMALNDSDALLAPRFTLNLRHDGGDGVTGTGVEVGGGLRLATGSRFSVDAAGSVLTLNSDKDEWSAGLSLQVSPDGAGGGLSLSLGPQWGVLRSGALSEADVFGRRYENANRFRTSADLYLRARAGYGVALVRGALTPFIELDSSHREDDYARYGAGIEFSLGRGLAAAFVGEKREAAGFPSDTRYGVDLRLTF